MIVPLNWHANARCCQTTKFKQLNFDGHRLESESDSYESDIVPTKEFWGVQQQFLLVYGYQLCSRYDPTWVPSWKGTSEKPIKNYKAENAPRIL
jgi:hypothetical protein